jgi:hypothetical protein
MMMVNVVPAKAGTQCLYFQRRWIPAYAGMTSGRHRQKAVLVRFSRHAMPRGKLDVASGYVRKLRFPKHNVPHAMTEP